jgi:hypothetical protein
LQIAGLIGPLTRFRERLPDYAREDRFFEFCLDDVWEFCPRWGNQFYPIVMVRIV